MDLEKIASIVSVVLSAIATIVATLKKGGKNLTIEEIEAKAEIKKQKMIAKACKKNKIDTSASTKSEVAQVTGQTTEVATQSQGQQPVINYISRG